MTPPKVLYWHSGCMGRRISEEICLRLKPENKAYKLDECANCHAIKYKREK